MAKLSEGQLYRLTDDELLAHLEERSHMSPVIGELTRRMRLLMDEDRKTDYNSQSECPVCQASLHIDFDESNRLFEVKAVR